MDALVAEHVMQHPGKTVWYVSTDEHSSMIDFNWKGEADSYLEQHKHYGMFKAAEVYKRQDYPLYAYNRFHAGEVEEHLRQEGWLVSVKQKPDDYPFLNNDGDVRINTRCVVELFWMPVCGQPPERRRLWAFHDLVCIAICDAALQTRGIKVKLELELEGLITQ